MTFTMIQSVVLMLLILASYGAHGSGASLQAGVLDLPWQDELCCDSPLAHLIAEGGGTHAPESNRSKSDLPHHRRCSFRSLTTESHPQQPSGGTCLDILCRIDDNWENVTCDIQSSTSTTDTGLIVISLRRLLSQKDDSSVNDEATTSDNPVVCEGMDSFMCSVALDSTSSFVTMVTTSVSDAISPRVLLQVPARPEQPSPPVDLSHVQTIEAELILQWDPPDSLLDAGPVRYEVRYSSNSSHPAWQMESSEESRVPLDLKPKLNYTVQVRCSGSYHPPLWSDWSERHHIYLDTVSYIPEKTVARPGENVTVYCVFNDRSINASTAVWMLNFREPLHPSQYHTVNQWVSRIKVHPSENQMYDVLQCTQWTIPYSQIYVEGAFIDISCETNGDIDAMDCTWKNNQWTKPRFRYRWADLPCDVMEERDRADEREEDTGPACLPARSRQESCTIQPLRMNCYKLWLEIPSLLGPVRSKPIYLSPTDHVKPHSPTNVKAVTRSSKALVVTWEPPSLPAEGLQCQFRYSSLSTVRAQLEWKVLSPVRVPWDEIPVPDMCRVYAVQARCMHTNGTGYWSDWSDSVYSTPQNSRAPERGPDFWRILQDDPHRNQTNVTLLFERMPALGRSYCVDGFIIRRQNLAGVVTREHVDVVSSYSFEWNQELVTVTVEAYNSLGSSANNINMTLDSQPRRRCVRLFHVLVINSTCVSLSWSLLDNSSVPLFMVVQWSPQRHQDADLHKGQNGQTWARLPYTERSVYLRGDFFGPEEFGFYLQPVFGDGEGEAVYATATRGDPAAYVMLMICSFLSVVLLITLVLSQNQMKKLMWKDVPNPNKCSWAKGLDLRKADSFRAAEGLQAWPMLPPSENISKVVIVEKADLSAMTSVLIQTPLVSSSPDAVTALAMYHSPGFHSKVEQTQFMENEVLAVCTRASSDNLDSLTSSHPSTEVLLRVETAEDQLPVATDSSAQSSVTYATVLLSNPKADANPLHFKDGSGSSSDEGNFSANNSEISGSFPGGLWELDSCRGGDTEDVRRSCSYNSVEELSETEQPDGGDVKVEKELFYLGMDYPAEDEESEEEGEQRDELLKNVVLNREACCLESNPLLGPDSSSESIELPPVSTCGFSQLYLPQFRTAPSTRQLHDSKPHL